MIFYMERGLCTTHGLLFRWYRINMGKVYSVWYFMMI